MFHALPSHIKKHLFFHNGAHVYMNNWQSIDFRESMNALLSQKLLGYENNYQLPTVIWQDNSGEQTWTTLETFGGEKEAVLPLGTGSQTISNQYAQEDFDRYGKSYPAFHQDLYTGKANQISMELPVTEDLLLNGQVTLKLLVASSVAKGLLSAQLLDKGSKKRLAPIPTPKTRLSLDNGRYHAQENLVELPYVEMPQRLVTKGFMNLQNRTDLMTVEEVVPDQWMDLSWKLQPTIYQLKKGDVLELILYTTDFECTIRDNNDWTISIDLDHSAIHIPVQ